MNRFTCGRCGRAFSITPETLARFPGFHPELCYKCKVASSPRAKAAPSRALEPTAGVGRTRVSALTPDEVLERFHEGPESGVFTDGSAEPNPGPGGYAAVYVGDGRILDQASGREAMSTNNRMELMALIAGYRLVPSGRPAVAYSDSQLCVNTINLWAPQWAKRGWKRKTGAIKNLELVKELYALATARPDIELRWIKAHAGYRWNEYADALAERARRSLFSG
jgi:ribonuclease HI